MGSPATTTPIAQPIYLRIKRHKSTYFVTANTLDELGSLKQKLVDILNSTIEKSQDISLDIGQGNVAGFIPIPKDSKRIQLFISDENDPPVFTSLDNDDETLQKLGLEDKQILFLTFWIEEEHKWEPVQVEWPDPIEEYDGSVGATGTVDEQQQRTINSAEDGKGKSTHRN